MRQGRRHSTGRSDAVRSLGMRAALIGHLALVLTLAAQGAALTPRVISTRFATADIVVATAVITEKPFRAKPDGKADCTTPVQRAIDAVARAGGGVVFFPAGRYLFRGNLHLRSTVTLRGDWQSPEHDPVVRGTILMPTGGRGKADGPPFISMEAGSGIRNLSIWYPDQRPEAIVPYPWTVQLNPRKGADNRTIQHVTLVNSYQAFWFGPRGDELHTIRDVHGTPLVCGIRLDFCTDIGRLIHVRFGPELWLKSGLMERTPEREAALRELLRTRGTALFIKRSDWEYSFDLRFRGYARGIHVKGFTNAVFYDVEASGGGVGLQADELNFIGLALTNCRLDGSQAGVLGRFKSVCLFNNCTIGGGAAVGARLEGNGLSGFVNCTFPGWRDAAVSAARGSASLLGCEFKKDATSVRIERSVRWAHLVGNRFAGTPKLDIQTKDNVRVLHGIPAFRRPSSDPIVLPPDPKPATTQLFNVHDYGAHGDVDEDSTRPFQAALDAAGKAGGGTVYVPGRTYRFEGTLTVPTGVEVRGCFDVPHHTVSGGSTLMPVGGRGKEDGTPFLTLSPKSGLRGFTVWYPDQDIRHVTPYPWSVRAAGPGCWVQDVCLSNPYQGVDFSTHPSDGHLLRYLCGAPLRRGLRVGKGSGVVDSCHFNPHYWARKPAGYPVPEGHPVGRQLTERTWTFQQHNLDAFHFGDCPRTLQVNNFVYACLHGLHFAGSGTGSSGRIVNHGSDRATHGVTIERGGNLELVNTEMAPPGTALLVTDRFAGTAALFNSLSWWGRGKKTAELRGKGDILLQQWHSTIGPINVHAGRVDIQALCFDRGGIQVQAGPQIEKLTLIGNTATGDETFRFTPGSAVKGVCNGRSPGSEPRTDVNLRAAPESGVHTAPLTVRLQFEPTDLRVRFTLDGSSPRPTSSLYTEPIVLDKRGAYELRCSPFDTAGQRMGAEKVVLYGVK